MLIVVELRYSENRDYQCDSISSDRPNSDFERFNILKPLPFKVI